MTVLPTDTPVTTPVAETVATALFAVRHVSAVLTPGSSVTVATSARVSPVANVSVEGVSVIVPAEVTVTGALAVTRGSPTAVARTTVEPGVTPVTTPCAFTDATDGLSVIHRSSRSAPASASTVAVSGCCPPAINVTAGGVSVIERIASTVTLISSDRSPVRARTVALPGARAVTTAVVPLPATSTMAGSELVQLTATPDSVMPLASRATTVMVWDAPIAARSSVPTELSNRVGVPPLPPLPPPPVPVLPPSAGAAHPWTPTANMPSSRGANQRKAVRRSAAGRATGEPRRNGIAGMGTARIGTGRSARPSGAGGIPDVTWPRERSGESYPG